MRQLAGVACVLCGKPIASKVVGRFCDVCGAPVHNKCMSSLRQEAPPSQDITRLLVREQGKPMETAAAEGDCPTCGAMGTDVRRELELHRQDHLERIAESKHRGGLGISIAVCCALLFFYLFRVLLAIVISGK